MSRARLNTLLALLTLVFGGLGWRLVVLQIHRHEDYREQAERRRRRLEFIAPRRGRLLDRDGRVLATDLPIIQVCLELTRFDPVLEVALGLARLSGDDRQETLDAVALARLHGRDKDAYAIITRPIPEARIGRISKGIGRYERSLRKRWRERGHEPPARPFLKHVAGRGIALAMTSLEMSQAALERLATQLEVATGSLQRQVDERLREILAIEDLYTRLAAWAEPLVIAEGLEYERAMAVEERLFELPGVAVRRRFRRHYPEGDMAAHLIGYNGPLSPKLLRSRAAKGLILDLPSWAHRKLQRSGEIGAAEHPREALLFGRIDRIDDAACLYEGEAGLAGLERAHHARLAGRPGARVVERNSKGQSLGLLHAIPERHGQDLRLTLDLELQRAAESALDQALAEHGCEDSGGAAVVIDISNGAIRALASAPRYDANRLNSSYRELLADPRKPLYHRAASAMPPGSTFKILTALALFDGDEGALPANQTFECGGRLLKSARSFKCDGVHGQVNLPLSLEQSCNIFYWRGVSQRGYDRVFDWARRVGFGQRVSLGVPGEHAGRLPSKAAKRERYRRAVDNAARYQARVDALRDPSADASARESARRQFARARDWEQRCKQDQAFTKGNAWNSVIGQGELLASPIQIARLTALIASDGALVTPHLLVGTAAPRARLDIDPRLLQRVQRGLRRVITSGTASRAEIGLRRYDVAGKTGTAERRPGEPMYAWFTGYYPSSEPRIAFAVVIDRTEGHGGGVAGPVARRIIDAYESREATR